MAAYNWTKIMDMKSNSELLEIVDSNPDNLESEAILAAKDEITKRENQESFRLEPQFPEKPTINEREQSLKKSVFSLVVFIAAFYLVFKWDFKYVLVLTVVIFIHELGHLTAMKLFKYKDLSLFFIPLLGALASGQKDEISQKQKVIVALSGPLPGVIIGTIVWIVSMRSGSEFLNRCGNIFIYLNLFNLLPIMPLDGGRIIKSLFFESNEKINIFFLWISIVILAYFALKWESYFLLLIPFFLFMQLKSQTQIKNFRMHIKNKGIDINRSFADLSKEEYWLIRDELAIHMQGFSNFIEPKRYFQAQSEDRVINMINQVIGKQPTKDINIGGKILFISAWLLAFILPVAALLIYYFVSGQIE